MVSSNSFFAEPKLALGPAERNGKDACDSLHSGEQFLLADFFSPSG